MKHLGGMRYYGGKHPKWSLTHWIKSMLPWSYPSLYCEPFCGMCGVLLVRAETTTEIINDINGRLINWWQMIRDKPEEFGRMLEWTHQKSQIEFDAALKDLDHEDPVRRAVAFQIVVGSSLQHGDKKSNKLSKTYYPGPGKTGTWTSSEIQQLHARTKDVQLFSEDGIDILNKIHSVSNAVIYVDPPYPTAETSTYRFIPDYDKLTDALLQQQGCVAVSGYNDEWDHLGWRCEEFETVVQAYREDKGMQSSSRTEKLWLNYDPPKQQGLFTS